MKYNLIFVLGEKNLTDGSVHVDLSGQTHEGVVKGLLTDVPCWDVTASWDSSVVKMKMKVDDVYSWLLQLENRFQ